MKLSLLFAGCILTLALSAALRGPAAADPPAAPQEPTTATPAPTPVPEWDPQKDGVGDQTEGPLEELVPLGERKAIPIVDQEKVFTPEEFLRYVKENVDGKLGRNGNLKPEFIVLHNTGIPTIAQRPNGFTRENMRALAGYYGGLGWPAGPHLFIDQNGIWVFSSLTKRGTHSPSWNRKTWGVEQLGDFNKDDYDGEVGSRIRANAVAALAILSIASGKDIDTLRFHKDDHRTTHDCPGRTCQKPRVIADVKAEMGKWRAAWNSR